MSDFLDQKHKEITDRLKELKPHVEEHARLEAAAAALASVGAKANRGGSTHIFVKLTKQG